MNSPAESILDRPFVPTPAVRAAGRVSRLAMLCAVLAAASAGPALSLPMASQGGFMTMADLNSSGERDLAMNYAFTGRDAFGVMAARWHEPVLHAGVHRRHAEREAAGLTYTRLVHRWNLPHAQANLWFVGSAGRARGEQGFQAQGFWSPAVMADYETTRVYLGAGWEPKRGSSLRHDVGWLRAGFSFYEVDYEQVQPWFIVEAKRTRSLGASSDLVTPLLRFIHRGLFVELGRNREGTQFNLMWAY
jgi:hypothetical protein